MLSVLLDIVKCFELFLKIKLKPKKLLLVIIIIIVYMCIYISHSSWSLQVPQWYIPIHVPLTSVIIISPGSTYIFLSSPLSFRVPEWYFRSPHHSEFWTLMQAWPACSRMVYTYPCPSHLCHYYVPRQNIHISVLLTLVISCSRAVFLFSTSQQVLDSEVSWACNRSMLICALDNSRRSSVITCRHVMLN